MQEAEERSIETSNMRPKTQVALITMRVDQKETAAAHPRKSGSPGAASFDELPDGSKWPLVVTGEWDYVPLEY